MALYRYLCPIKNASIDPSLSQSVPPSVLTKVSKEVKKAEARPKKCSAYTCTWWLPRRKRQGWQCMEASTGLVLLSSTSIKNLALASQISLYTCRCDILSHMTPHKNAPSQSTKMRANRPTCTKRSKFIWHHSGIGLSNHEILKPQKLILETCDSFHENLHLWKLPTIR